MADLAYVLLTLAGFAALLLLVRVLDTAGPVAPPDDVAPPRAAEPAAGRTPAPTGGAR